LRAELEHRGAIDAGAQVALTWDDTQSPALHVWLVEASGAVPTGARVVPLAG
jgi:hypothetical protein